MHKNIPVVDLLIDEDSGFIDNIHTVHDYARLPLGTVETSTAKNGALNRGYLNAWWVGRSIPASRENIQAALINLGARSTAALLLKCYGLSLSDHYWVRPENTNLQWNEINFFQNDFSKDVGEILFGHEPTDRSGLDLMSPDNTSDGWLKKKWVIVDGKRMLMKGGSGDYQQEPFNELVASAIMRRLKIPHVPYVLTFDGGHPYSLCETFVTPETELIPALRAWEARKQSNHNSAYAHMLRCAEALGIPHVREALEKMLVLDYIIGNTDRHLNNFGFIRNVNTLEWQGIAPIYDSGTALWHDTQYVGRAPKSKPFRPTHSEQIKLVQDFNWFDYDALQGLGDECAEIFNQSDWIDAKRRDALVRAIEVRAKEIAQMRSVTRPKPGLSEALQIAQEKVDAQTSDKIPHSKRHDER